MIHGPMKGSILQSPGLSPKRRNSFPFSSFVTALRPAGAPPIKPHRHLPLDRFGRVSGQIRHFPTILKEEKFSTSQAEWSVGSTDDTMMSALKIYTWFQVIVSRGLQFNFSDSIFIYYLDFISVWTNDKSLGHLVDTTFERRKSFL